MFNPFKKKPDYRAEAERTFNLCKILSVTSTGPVTQRFPALDAIFSRPDFSMVGHWDFFVTWAGIGTSLLVYRSRGPSDIEGFTTALLQLAERWDHQASDAIVDFQAFVNRNVAAGIDLPVAVGSWIVWNLKGSTPSDAELQASPAIGSLIVTGLRSSQTDAA